MENLKNSAKPAPRIIDSDGHVRETENEIIEYMSAGYRARRDAMLYFPLVPHHGWHRSIPANDYRHQNFRVPDWREWAGKLDEGNISLTVLYPTRFMHIGQIGNPAYAVELCRAYNDYLNEQFLVHDRRFRGMALLPLQDVPRRSKNSGERSNHYGMAGGIVPAEGCLAPGSSAVLAGFPGGGPPRLRVIRSLVHFAQGQRPILTAQRGCTLDPM